MEHYSAEAILSGLTDKSQPGLKRSFQPRAIEGKAGYDVNNYSVENILKTLDILKSLYPQYSETIDSIASDCIVFYQFKDGINSLEDFKAELLKFYIHNERLAKLVAEVDEDSDIEPYGLLYSIYKSQGSLEIQRRIDKLQVIDIQTLSNAELGIKPQVIKPMEPRVFTEDEIREIFS